ncbi:hypothetical protein ACFWC5_40905 [Streptomyces sp. NPDC060085]|uniref:hypothetical protein n=1 Tax=Streptomyces sp. NPDC060085 TaxID=3347054 RepID=UPI003665EBA3
MTTTRTDPAALVRQARDLIEELNHVVLDDAGTLSAPALSDTVQALKSLVERLPQAFEQTGTALVMLADQDKVVLDNGQDPKAATTQVAAELRAVAASSEQLARDLSHPASALFLMGGR